MLIDGFLNRATEVDVDAICDVNNDVFIAGIMEHIEEAGVHSGDCACSLPPHSLKPDIIAEIERQTNAMARALKVRGLMNVQYAIQGNEIYVLEVNPRASRTVPFVAKAIGLPVAAIASRVMAGETLASFNLKPPAPEAYLGQGSGAAFRALSRRRHGAGTGDALHRRSDGRWTTISAAPSPRARSAPAPGCRPRARCSSRSRMATRTWSTGPARRLVAMGFSLVATRGTARCWKRRA